MRAVEEVWASWARRHGLSYLPPSSTGWTLSPPRARGVVDGVLVNLDGMELDPHDVVAPSASRHERRRMPHTALAAAPQRADRGEMIVMSRARLDTGSPAQGYRQMDLADARFDEACALFAGPWSPTQGLGDRAVRAALVHLARRPFVLFAQGGSLWIRWPGYERDPEVLDHALTALVGLARERA